MTVQRSIGVALLISLMLNAFTVGVLVSQSRHKPVAEDMAGPGERSHRLPPMAAELFRKLRKAPDGAMGEAIASAREARDLVQSALTAEPFDPQALSDAFARLRESESELARQAQMRILNLASELSAQERADLARMQARRMGPVPRRLPPADGRRPPSPEGHYPPPEGQRPPGDQH